MVFVIPRQRQIQKINDCKLKRKEKKKNEDIIQKLFENNDERLIFLNNFWIDFTRNDNKNGDFKCTHAISPYI